MHQRQHTGEIAETKGDLAFYSQVGNIFIQNLKMNKPLPRRLHLFITPSSPFHILIEVAISVS